MNEYFPAPSSESLTSEYFVPARFLLKHHRGTSFDDLKAGLSHLQRKVGAHKEGQLSFLKVKILAFFLDLADIFLIGQCWGCDGSTRHPLRVERKV